MLFRNKFIRYARSEQIRKSYNLKKPFGSSKPLVLNEVANIGQIFQCPKVIDLSINKLYYYIYIRVIN